LVGPTAGSASRDPDSSKLSQAAEVYRAALALAPLRTDIRVQYGNMLKDAGRLAEAEAATGPRTPKNPTTQTFTCSSDIA
jgi:predicted Zn-dependent protease